MLLWDPATRQIVMANAGALPPMICRGGEILKIRVEGVPIGLLDAREYEEVTFQAQPGDTIVLYSDGITDHMNAAGHGIRPRPPGADRCGRTATARRDDLIWHNLQRAGQVLHDGLRRSDACS